MIYQVLLNIVGMVIIILLLLFMQRRFVSFSKRVFTGLGLGIVFGLMLQFMYGSGSEVVKSSVDWFNIMGNGYIKLLQMVVMPLVFISILSAFTKATLSHNIGKIGGLIIGLLVGTTAIAAAIGIGASIAADLQSLQLEQGAKESAQIEKIGNTLGNLENMSAPQKLVELLPGNPFLDLTGARPTSTIAVVIFSAFLGMAYIGVKRKKPDQAELFAKITDSLYTMIMRVVTLILRLTPYGVLALMTKIAATSDLMAIWRLGKFVLASYVALLIMFGVHLLLITLSGLNPVTYVKKVIPVLTFAFTSRSSAGTLPLNVQTQNKELGVPEGIANFAGSF